MDLDLNYAICALAKNLGYALVVFLGVVWIISLLVNDRDARGWTIKGSAIILIVSALIFTFSMGSLQFPAFDNFVKNVWESGLSLTAAQANSSTPNVNIQVDIPEQSPPTIIVQGNDVPISTPEVVDEPTEAVIPDSDSDISFSDRAEMFDLGSQVDGYFSDGTPYFNYEVQPGDTVYSIKEEHNIPEGELTGRNGIDIRRYRIFAGDILKISIIDGE